MHTNVRNKPGMDSEITDTVYNLQIVKTEMYSISDNWIKVVLSSNTTGYIHQSRLQPISQKHEAILDSIWNVNNNLYDSENYYNEYFVTGIDCPEIILSILPTTKQDDFYKKINYDHIFRLSYIDIYGIGGCIINLYTKDTLHSFNNIITEPSIEIWPGQIIFKQSQCRYAFYRNQKNKLCQNVDYLGIDFYRLTDQELISVLTIAREARDAINKSNSGMRNERSKIVGQYIKTNDFKYLAKLASAYIHGHEEAKKLYDTISYYFPFDGEGTHEFDRFLIRLWAYTNRGETELNEIKHSKK